LSTGQNLAMGYENWTQAVGGWIEEKEYYSHGYPSTGIVGHYTQVNPTCEKQYEIKNFCYLFFSPDDLAFCSISWLCSYYVPSLWSI
jgi:hypothetical protein